MMRTKIIYKKSMILSLEAIKFSGVYWVKPGSTSVPKNYPVSNCDFMFYNTKIHTHTHTHTVMGGTAICHNFTHAPKIDSKFKKFIEFSQMLN